MDPAEFLDLLILAALGLGAYAIYRILELRHEESLGRLVAVDFGSVPGPPLRAEAWRLSGRPDEIRSLPDGTWIPVEWKSRGTPRNGPAESHRLQLLAYCLLCEVQRGSPPPYGVLRYGDGQEFRIPWDRSARRELWAVRLEMAAAYDGRARPSPGKCAGCRWRDGCSARAG